MRRDTIRDYSRCKNRKHTHQQHNHEVVTDGKTVKFEAIRHTQRTEETEDTKEEEEDKCRYSIDELMNAPSLADTRELDKLTNEQWVSLLTKSNLNFCPFASFSKAMKQSDILYALTVFI